MNRPMSSPHDCVARATDWFARLTRESLDSIGEVYAPDAHFKDPFNDVKGVDRIRAIYLHMFENLIDPRFEIIQTIEQITSSTGLQVRAPDQQGHVHAFVAWQFKFEWHGQTFDIPGGTRFLFDGFGLIADHVDYWDVAAGLYEKLPIIGALLRMLRKRMAAPQA